MSIARNSLYGFAGHALPLLANIATVPLYIEIIGPERYGALMIAWLLLAYFGQADFGIGRAIAQRIASIRQSDPSQLAAVVWSGLALIAGISLAIGLTVYWAASWYFAGPFEIDPALRAELLASVWVMALCAPVVAVAGVFSGALTGLERFGLQSGAVFASSMALQILPLVVAVTVGPDLVWLVLASLASRVILLAIVGASVWRHLLKCRPARASRGEMRRLGSYGSWIMITALVGPIMSLADRFAIGAILGAAAVAAFVIPANIAQRAVLAPQMVTHALFPRFAAEDALASLARCRDYMIFIAQTFAPVAIGLICLAAPLLELWLGEKLDPRSVAVGQIVMAGCWANAMGHVAMAHILARGDPRFVALTHLIEAPLYLALLFALGTSFGLAGAAAAWSLRCVVDTIVLIWRSGAADRSLAIGLAVPAILVSAALAAGPFLTGWPESLGAATVLGTASLAVIALLMPSDLRAKLAAWPIARRVPWLLNTRAPR